MMDTVYEVTFLALYALFFELNVYEGYYTTLHHLHNLVWLQINLSEQNTNGPLRHKLCAPTSRFQPARRKQKVTRFRGQLVTSKWKIRTISSPGLTRHAKWKALQVCNLAMSSFDPKVTVDILLSFFSFFVLRFFAGGSFGPLPESSWKHKAFKDSTFPSARFTLWWLKDTPTSE